MNPLVRLEQDGDIAVITVDNPPVNAGSQGVRAGITAALDRIRSDPAVQGAVIIGSGNTFISGSDLKEFDSPLQEPLLPAVIAAIENYPRPVVAALHGTALGGGYELALGCDARVAAPGTLLGLPEVTLGMIPGAGGAQRLPRLVGVARAIELISTGARIKASVALAEGMIDAIAEGGLRAFAVDHARRMQGQKRLLRHLAPRTEDAETIERAAQAALKAGRHRPQVQAAIAAVSSSVDTPIDEALAQDRSTFERLRSSNEASALRHLFFSERESSRHPELQDIAARPVERIAIIGAGTMGTGIALAALAGGFDVALLEQNPAVLAQSTRRIGEHYEQRIAAGKLSSRDADAQRARLSAGAHDDLLAGAQLAIEAVYEDLTVKRGVLSHIESLLPPDVILASNTSYIDLDAIAEATERPHNVLGLHFFSPAHVMRLLEVVRGARTAPEVLATGFAVARRLGKLPILTGNAFGFIGNRIYAAYRRQCEFMLEEGALPESIDAALEAFGFAMGPFAVADMSGLDIAWAMRQANAARRDPQARYVDIPDRLCELKRFGRKSGAGYYRYENPSRRGEPDPLVTELIEEASRRKGISRRTFAAAEIQERVLLTMANEAALLLSEGVTTRAGDVDLVMTNGFGFPKWEGGPVFWAARQDATRLAQGQDRLARASGKGFVRGELDILRRSLPADRRPVGP
jgi:3-hydroxyacyl-CoA dehydrogenase